LVGFLVTLRPGSTPMIERFARLRVSNLSGATRAWCRLWTWIWCGYFLVNGGVSLAFARAASLTWWALYNGLIAYALLGTLLGTEWVMRRRRFGRQPDAAGDDARRAAARQSDAGLGGAGAGRGAGGGVRVPDGKLPRPGA
jgi:uncharacterized membrane protein